MRRSVHENPKSMLSRPTFVRGLPGLKRHQLDVWEILLELQWMGGKLRKQYDTMSEYK